MPVPKDPIRYAAIAALDTPRYLSKDVAAAAGIASGLLKAWVSRGITPLGGHDQEGRGKGTPRLFTLRRALCIALTAELASLGLTASRAGLLAFTFTDVDVEKKGRRPVEWQRAPLLVVYPETEIFRFATGRESLARAMDLDQTHSISTRPASCLVINCSALVQRVKARFAERGA